jgi:beta-phosphoglucomutase-like phosphatase (HAD superfamily)
VVAARDHVANGKPDPEIYHLVARQLGVTPGECLVIEDSSSGVKAALAAGMGCIVVTTDLTRQSVHKNGLLDPRWIVDHPQDLEMVVKRYLEEHE